jgi:flagellar protein FlaJ
MAFDGLKKFFNIIGDITVTSSKKVGDGVSKPVEKLNDAKKERKVKGKTTKNEKESPSFLGGLKQKNVPKSSRFIKQKTMNKEEIEIFKELINPEYEGTKRRSSEKEDVKRKKEAYNRASLEEMLKGEEKEELDPKLIVVLAAISFVVVFGAVVVLGFGVELGLAFGLIVFMMAMVIIFLPNIQKGKKTNEASKELPFALRQMATELSAGIGLHDSIRSVSLSGYGALSEEFARTLEEIKYGETTDKALRDMAERINSEGLDRAINQITRTLASGGNLAKTLNVIAEDVAYEMRMKLKDYAQKLNSFTMIYMFIAILFPVITMVMLIAASTVLGPLVPPELILVMYLFLFPLVVAFMAFMIKRLEPQI